MATAPPVPDGFELVSPRDPWAILQQEGFTASNGYRTRQDTARIRRQGYVPAPNSPHLEGDAIDLDHPGMSRAQQVARLRELFGGWPGFRLRDEGHHRHMQLPGWGAAPGTPGTANSGLPPIPEGFELEQRGSLRDGNFLTGDAVAALPSPNAAPADPAALPDWGGSRELLEERAARTREVAAAAARRPASGEMIAASPSSVRPYRPEGTELMNASADPGALAPLNAAYQRGAPLAELMSIANGIGAVAATPGFTAQLRAAVAWRDQNPDAARSHSPFVPGEIRRGVEDNRPEATLSEHDRGLTERLGDALSGILEPVVGRHVATEAGNNAEDLAWWTGVGAAEDTLNYNDAYNRAMIEGRPLDMAGNQVGAQVSAMGMIPIIGPGARRVGQGARNLRSRIAGLFGRGDDAGAAASRAEGMQDEAGRAAMAATGGDAPPVPGTVADDIPPIPAGFELETPPLRAPPTPEEMSPAARAILSGEAPTLPPGNADAFRRRGPVPVVPSNEPEMGRVIPFTPRPPAEIADAARSIGPEDVRPIPANRVESYEEAVRANPGTIRDYQASRPEAYLDMRTLPHPRDSQRAIRHRGPLDAVAFLRYTGGVRDQGGDLRHLGVTNLPRAGTGDRQLGSLIRKDGMTLDEAGEALWGAGYFRERPDINQVLDVLADAQYGRRLWHPSDLEEVARYEAALDDWNAVTRAADEGAPAAERIGSRIGRDDLDALDPPATAYEELPRAGGRAGNINLANIETTRDIRRLLNNVEEGFGGFDAARRGTITHAETAALADELGMTAKDLMRRRQGQALNAEQALRARQLLAKSSDEVLRLAQNAIGPEASDVSRAAFSEALVLHAGIHEQVTGAVAEAGRTLSALRIAAKSRAVAGRIHEKAIEAIGGKRNLEDVAEGILDLRRQGATPGAVNRFAVEAIRPRNREKLVELYLMGLLSGIKTHVVNIVSNASTQALQLPEYALASAYGQVRRGIRALRGKEDDMDRVLGSEVGARAVGLMQGAVEGIPAFARALRTGDAEDFVTKIENRSHRAISGLKGEIVRIPGRFLVAEDEYFKAIGRRMHVNAMAVRQARREGLRGDEARQRISDLSAHPTTEMLEGAREYARYLTFQNEMGAVGRRVSQTAREHPWLRLALPFIRTPANLLKFAAERSPAGLFLRSVRDDLRAGGQRQALAASRMALGTGMGLFAMKLAEDGVITGGGPADEGARQMMMANGWQPYSVRVGDRYYSYARLDPLSTTLGVAADMVDYGERMTKGQQTRSVALLITSIMRNLANKTWLSGVSDMIGALDDPDRNLNSFVARLGGSVAVPTLVSHVSQAMDPVMRETRAPTFSTEGIVPDNLRGIADPTIARIQSRIPGQSEGFPARYDVMGQPIVSGEGPISTMLNPFPTREARNDPVVDELLRLEVNVSRPSRRAAGGEYSGWEYERYQELAGRYMRADLVAEMSDPAWQGLTDDERRTRVRAIIRRARRDARENIATPDNSPMPMPDPPPPAGFQREMPALPPGFELEG